MKRKPIVVIIAALASACVGGILGLMVGVYANYGIAQFFADGREAQAYFTLLVIPCVSLVGAATGLFLALTVLWKRWMAAPAALGGATLLLATGLGASFSGNHRPAEVTIENRTNLPFERVFLGGDFRRSTRVGDIAPGATSDPIRVDLDTPGTYDKIEGRAGDGYVRNTFHEHRALPDGNYTIVVSGELPKFDYEFRSNTAPAR
ncbi:MAG: hypothetical protein R3E66_01925 [bacterium]